MCYERGSKLITRSTCSADESISISKVDRSCRINPFKGGHNDGPRDTWRHIGCKWRFMGWKVVGCWSSTAIERFCLVGRGPIWAWERVGAASGWSIPCVTLTTCKRCLSKHSLTIISEWHPGNQKDNCNVFVMVHWYCQMKGRFPFSQKFIPIRTQWNYLYTGCFFHWYPPKQLKYGRKN